MQGESTMKQSRPATNTKPSSAATNADKTEKGERETTLATVAKAQASVKKVKCPFCKEGHFPTGCSSFTGKTFEERLALVKEKRLCQNCLKKGHEVAACYMLRVVVSAENITLCYIVIIPQHQAGRPRMSSQRKPMQKTKLWISIKHCSLPAQIA